MGENGARGEPAAVEIAARFVPTRCPALISAAVKIRRAAGSSTVATGSRSRRNTVRTILPQCPRTGSGQDASDPSPTAGLPDRTAGKRRFDWTCQRFVFVLRIRTIRTHECPPERMHRALRPTTLGGLHEQSILAPRQSVSAPAQFDFFLRMQRMAHLMRLRALTIVIRPGRDRFSHNSILTSSAGG